MAAIIAVVGLIGPLVKLTQQLKPFLGKRLRVRAWGADLPGGLEFELVRVVALGAGLHLYLRATPATSAIHFKIAQPRQVQVTEASVRIAVVKYLQWAGRKLPRPSASTPAVEIEFVP